MIPESMLAGHKITVNANRNAKVKQNDHDKKEVSNEDVICHRGLTFSPQVLCDRGASGSVNGMLKEESKTFKLNH